MKNKTCRYHIKPNVLCKRKATEVCGGWLMWCKQHDKKLNELEAKCGGGFTAEPDVRPKLVILKEQYTQLIDDLEQAKKLLRVFVDFMDLDCRLDHHGLCQEHLITMPCEVMLARKFLGLI